MTSLGAKKINKRFSVAKPGNVKKTDFQIYVLSEPTLFTPKGDEDLELVHAGLGKRLLTVPDSFKHSEVVANIIIMQVII